MPQPWTGPLVLLDTIRAIKNNPEKKLKDINPIPFLSLKTLDLNKRVPRSVLYELIALLKKVAPALYERHESELRGPVKIPKRFPSFNRKPKAVYNFNSYDELFPRDLGFLEYYLRYIFDFPDDRTIDLIPIQTVMTIVPLMRYPKFFMGYLAAQQLIGMITHHYARKKLPSLNHRMHFEHGLVVSALPDAILNYASRIKNKEQGTREAFRHHFKTLLKEAIKTGSFTKSELAEWFETDKDLVNSRVRDILRDIIE